MGQNMKVVLLCGCKQSGKTTTATSIYGYLLTGCGAIPNAQIDENGQMSIVYDKEKNEGIIFDIDSEDPEFLEFKNRQTSQFINHVGFAYELKRTSSNLFGLDYSKLIGTNDQKNELCHIKWADMNKVLPGNKKRKNPPEFMTHREFLEVFGTLVAREIDPECHIRSAWNKLKTLNPQLGMFTDCRFSNEFEIVEQKAKEEGIELLSIRFLRNPYKSDAPSEVGLDSIDNSRFSLLVPEDIPIPERNKLVIDFLVEKNFLSNKNIKVV